MNLDMVIHNGIIVTMNAGFDVKKAEVHGMAQRGGDVTTHFRFGEKVYSPLIKQGEVDYLISFELLEALRYINWVKPEGKIILNNYRILPPAVTMGKMDYPKGVDRVFRKHFRENVWVVDGSRIAKELGNVQVANVVLLGALSRFFPELEENQWIDAIKELLPTKLHKINLKAFHEGSAAIAFKSK